MSSHAIGEKTVIIIPELFQELFFLEFNQTNGEVLLRAKNVLHVHATTPPSTASMLLQSFFAVIIINIPLLTIT